ncbi:uncharacterized protein METZ01_LOCUS218316 [marine metagenome]|uniref:Tetratricopeptide repeat protein n=1 Tax=marine metagenome TaxID=408172 RepID=A0A382FS83_9ZZZZ
MALTKEQIKEFKEAEKEAQDSDDFREVAKNIAEAGDKEWAKKTYEKAEEKTDDPYELYYLAQCICENLGDKEWAKKTYEKVEEKAKDYSQFKSLANDICEKLGDKDWGKKLYKKALSKVSLLKLDLENGFHSVKKETTRGTRAIQALSKQVGSVGSSAWSEAYSEIFIFNEGEKYTRGSRKIKTTE